MPSKKLSDLTDAELLKLEETLARRETISGLESLARGFGEGITAGQLPEIAGALQEPSEFRFLGTPEQREQEKQAVVASQEQAQVDARAANPSLFAAGDIGGSIAFGVVPGAAAIKATKGLGKVGAALGRSTVFAAEGAAQAAGRGQDAKTGAALGILSGVVGQATVAAIKNSGSKVLQLAAQGKFGVEAQKMAIARGRKIAELQFTKNDVKKMFKQEDEIVKFQNDFSELVSKDPSIASALKETTERAVEGLGKVTPSTMFEIPAVPFRAARESIATAKTGVSSLFDAGLQSSPNALTGGLGGAGPAVSESVFGP